MTTNKNLNFLNLIKFMSREEILNERKEVERRIAFMIANEEDVERLVIINNELEEREYGTSNRGTN